jgi:predicted nucleotide-binding protein (sugar kinase/HSP70/actin superfamily)
MDDVHNPDSPHEYAQVQERVFARLKPDSAMEERLAQRIASCFHSLEHIQNRLTKTWSQLNKVQETFRHDPLS